jgi:hypothetical protein
MRLLMFKVQNFRSVVDSGWIDAERVTALIGVNESGKTNLLLPLWKLNPAKEGELKPTSDYPKGNYGAVRANPKNFWFIHAQFEVAELVDQLAQMTAVPGEFLSVVYVARNLPGNIGFLFRTILYRNSRAERTSSH